MHPLLIRGHGHFNLRDIYSIMFTKKLCIAGVVLALSAPVFAQVNLPVVGGNSSDNSNAQQRNDSQQNGSMNQRSNSASTNASSPVNVSADPNLQRNADNASRTVQQNRSNNSQSTQNNTGNNGGSGFRR